jgi:hypothetical protein
VAVIGAYRNNPGDINDAGSAYVYRFNGSAWLLNQTIPNPEPDVANNFGDAVAVSGNVVIVGAHGADPGGIGSAGSAYVYRYNGSTWLLEQVIPNPASAQFDFFGQSVALSGDVALIGAWSDAPGGVDDAGSAYVYRYNGAAWQLEQAFPNPAPAAGDRFGWSVAISGDVALVGAEYDSPSGVFRAGSAHVYRFNGAAWLLDQAIPNPDPTMDDHYGVSVAVSGDVAIVGAYFDDPGGISSSGSAYVYRYSGSLWMLDQSIPNPATPSGSDLFGVSVAVSGDVAMIGSHTHDPGGISDAGSAYVYRYDGSIWQLDLSIPNPMPAGGDWFGWSVAISGETAVVGAQLDHPGGVDDAGSAYVFNLQCVPVCCAGDFDGNSVVTNADVADFVAAMLAGGACPAPPACCPGDFNSDGIIDGNDLSGFLARLIAGGACP